MRGQWLNLARAVVFGGLLTAWPTIAWAGPNMHIDAPVTGTYQQKLWLAGWAIDSDAPSGTGVSAIHVWAYPNPGSGQAPIPLGVATYGLSRPDADLAFNGGGRYVNSGWSS